MMRDTSQYENELCGTDALAFLGVANVQQTSNPHIYQRLPTIVDRHEPEALQQQQDAGQAAQHGVGANDTGWLSC